MKKKLIIFSTVIVIILIAYVFDSFLASGYKIQTISINPNHAIADNKTPTEIKLKLTYRGKPVSNHDLNAVSLDGGSFKAYRIKTDKDGIATFIYYSYLASNILPVKTIRIRVRDESNSIIIAVPYEYYFEVPLDAPEGNGSGNKTNDSIFD